MANCEKELIRSTQSSLHYAQLAFAASYPLRRTTLLRPFPTTLSVRRRPRAPQVNKLRARIQQFSEWSAKQESKADENSEDRIEREQVDDDDDFVYEDIFVNEDERSFWQDLDVKTALQPITEEEKEKLREKLPLRVANFLIRRAEGVEKLREQGADESFFGKLLQDLPPDLPEDDDDEYSDYVFETVAGPPAFRRRGTSILGGGDGLPDVEDNSMDADTIDVGKGPPKNVMSMFVGRVGSIDEQASMVGYGLLALFALLLLVKIFFAFISFFVSFTFSFFAIFALSAGIFMVFFLFRW